jgi:hypothetical protein
MARIHNPYKDNKQNETTLEWKSHDYFFQDYYSLKGRYNNIFAKSMIDFKLVPETFAALFEFIGHCKGQILIKMDTKTILKAKDDILGLISSKKYIKALKSMEDFYEEVIKVCVFLELEPKPEEKPIDEVRTEKDDKIRAALQAYKLIMED